MEKIKEIKIREIVVVEVFEDYICFTEETKFLTKNQVQKPRVLLREFGKTFHPHKPEAMRRCDVWPLRTTSSREKLTSVIRRAFEKLYRFK